MNNTFSENSSGSDILKFMLLVSIEGLIGYIINNADMFMVGGLGERAVAAVGIANQLYNLLTYIYFAISNSTVIFAAQYWGKKDLKGLQKVLGISLKLTVVLAVIFSFVAIAFPEYIIRIFTEDTAVINIAADYMRIKGFSCIAIVITTCYLAILKSTGKAILPLIVSILALIESILFNYILIYGKLGFPAMGVRGAAISTCILRWTECIIALIIIYAKKYPAAAKLKDLVALDKEFIAKFFKVSLPMIVTEIVWYLGLITYNWIYARMGVESIAAINICTSIEGVGTTLFVGMTGTCAILISNYIGAGLKEKAFNIGKKFLWATIAGAAMIGLIIALSSKGILAYYSLSQAAYTNTRYLLIIAGCIFWVKTANFMIFVGIIKSGGATKFPMILELCSMWGLGIPLALIGAFVFHLPVYFVMPLAMADEIVKLVGALKRFFSRKWIINMVSQAEEVQSV